MKPGLQDLLRVLWDFLTPSWQVVRVWRHLDQRCQCEVCYASTSRLTAKAVISEPFLSQALLVIVERSGNRLQCPCPQVSVRRFKGSDFVWIVGMPWGPLSEAVFFVVSLWCCLSWIPLFLCLSVSTFGCIDHDLGGQLVENLFGTLHNCCWNPSETSCLDAVAATCTAWAD